MGISAYECVLRCSTLVAAVCTEPRKKICTAFGLSQVKSTCSHHHAAQGKAQQRMAGSVSGASHARRNETRLGSYAVGKRPIKLSTGAEAAAHVIADAPADFDRGADSPNRSGRRGLEDFATEVAHRRERVVGEHRLAGASVLRERSARHAAVGSGAATTIAVSIQPSAAGSQQNRNE